MKPCRLSEIVASSFWDVYKIIKSNAFTHYWFKGGRGSTKSSFISICIVLMLLKDRESNTIVFMKYGKHLRDGVYNQITWAINELGLAPYFKFQLSPLMIIYKPTEQCIMFRGLDDATKIKSIKPKKGLYKQIWFEELELFDGMEEIRKTTQSLMRGGTGFNVFYSYNPPISINNWVNMESMKPQKNRYVHESNYLDVPTDWLGEEFLIEADILKQLNERAYRHEYMGEAVGTGGNIFENVKSEVITDELIETFDCIREGIDFGFATDPFTWVKSHYDKTRMTLYIYDEIYRHGLSNEHAFELIKPRNQVEIIADCAEPKSIADLKNRGLKIKGAVKGADSIRFGVRFLQSLKTIIIDPIRCPKTLHEMLNYEYERNKQGEFKSGYPDKDNHIIDGLRYSLEKYALSKKGLWYE
jgi:phage terminase large subunit